MQEHGKKSNLIRPCFLEIRDKVFIWLNGIKKELDKLLKVLKAGDSIVFDSASRMSRNEAEAIELYEDLFKLI